jgi:GTPase SAR1 family protein
MTKIIATTGVDGSGKTSIINRLQNLNKSEIYPVFVPQYYSDESLPLTSLAETLEDIGKLADQHKSAILKANSFVLAISLLKEVIADITNRVAPKAILLERHPVIDTMMYAKFYGSQLAGEISEELKEEVFKMAGAERFIDMQVHAKKLGAKSFWEIHKIILPLLTRPTTELFEGLEILMGVSGIEKTFFIAPSEEELRRRQLLKEDTEENLEIHENLETILMLQSELAKLNNLLKSEKMGYDFLQIDNSKLTVEQSTDFISQEINA